MISLRQISFLITGSLVLAVLSGCFNSNFEIPDNVIVARDIDYADGHRLKKLDLYYCPQLLKPEGNPNIILIHGGLWVSGDKAWKNFPSLACELAQKGYIVASINYRLAPKDKWPAMIDDCSEALDWIVENADSLNIDLERIGVFGSSSGGHLASLLFTQERSRQKIKCNASLFGDYDLPALLDDCIIPFVGNIIRNKIFGNCGDDVLIQGSPLYNISGNPAEFGCNLSIHGTRDWMVDYSQAERFNSALQEKGIDSELISFDGTHGLQKYFKKEWPKIVDFFDEKL
ncbi:MAG: alpha/beta hydrolase [Candidatus Buchananbacteria bacterium]|nr:alpha/beta hydrolase [Candidatus Buchananbacteria bacterium]